jgi:protease I
MDQTLRGTKVAILVADGFEQVELTEPRNALQQAGAQTTLISPAQGTVKGWNFTEWGGRFDVDQSLDQARPEDFDALQLPGGVMNPDTLRINSKAAA